MSTLLLATATEMEASPLREELEDETSLQLPYGSGSRGSFEGLDLTLLHHGVGKVNTAAGLALAVDRLEPSGIIQFGIGGGYVGAFLSVGRVAIASCEIHIDTGARTASGWEDMESLGLPLLERERSWYNKFPTDPRLTAAASEATGQPPVAFGTSETVTGTFDEGRSLHDHFDVSVESMEGAAAAQVCLALNVPFAEIRGISNIVGERARHAWNIPGAVRAVNAALIQTLRFLAREGSLC